MDKNRPGMVIRIGPPDGPAEVNIDKPFTGKRFY
jgi:hypothetical protein